MQNDNNDADYDVPDWEWLQADSRPTRDTRHAAPHTTGLYTTIGTGWSTGRKGRGVGRRATRRAARRSACPASRRPAAHVVVVDPLLARLERAGRPPVWAPATGDGEVCLKVHGQRCHFLDSRWQHTRKHTLDTQQRGRPALQPPCWRRGWHSISASMTGAAGQGEQLAVVFLQS